MSADWKVNHKISSWTLLDTQNQPTTDLLIHLAVSYLRQKEKYIHDYSEDGVKYYFVTHIINRQLTFCYIWRPLILDRKKNTSMIIQVMGSNTTL